MRNSKTQKRQQTEVLHLSEPMVNDLIAKVEESIHAKTTQMNAALPALKEAEEMYLDLKRPYDALSDSVEQDKRTLEVLIGYKNNTNLRKNIRVHRSLSNAAQPKRKRAKEFYWIEAAIEVLTAEDKFLSGDTLLRKVLDNHPDWRVVFEQRRVLGTEIVIKKQLIKGFEKATAAKRPKIVVTDRGKFGLPDFFEGNTIKAKYLPSVMGPQTN